MFDFGFLTLPVMAALGLLGYGIYSGPAVVIEPIVVPHVLEDQGYTSDVVTRHLSDEIRRMSDVANSTLRPVNVDLSQIDRSYNALTDYFKVTQVIDAVRQSIGLVPYYFAGDIVMIGNEAEFRIRAYPAKGEVQEFVHRAPIDQIEKAIKSGSYDMLRVIDAYVAALYLREMEQLAGSKEFLRTQEAIRLAFGDLKPQDEHFIHLLWARTMQISGKLDDALRIADVTISIKPNFANAHFAKARTLVDMGRAEEALPSFQKAVALQPFAGEMYVDYARALTKLNRTDEAMTALRRALSLLPTNPDVHHQLGTMLMAAGKRDEAVGHFRQAIAYSNSHYSYFDDYKKALLAPGAGS